MSRSIHTPSMSVALMLCKAILSTTLTGDPESGYTNIDATDLFNLLYFCNPQESFYPMLPVNYHLVPSLTSLDGVPECQLSALNFCPFLSYQFISTNLSPYFFVPSFTTKCRSPARA